MALGAVALQLAPPAQFTLVVLDKGHDTEDARTDFAAERLDSETARPDFDFARPNPQAIRPDTHLLGIIPKKG